MKQMPEDLQKVLLRLARNGDMVMAGKLLRLYAVHKWKLSEAEVAYAARKWCLVHCPRKWEHYQRTRRKGGGPRNSQHS